VTIDSLVKAGVVSKPRNGLRLLGSGELKAKLAFEVHHASKGAIAAVEKAGGSVKVLKSAKVENEHEVKARAAKAARLEALKSKPEVKEAKAPKAEAKPAKAEAKPAKVEAKADEKPAKAKKEEKPAKK